MRRLVVLASLASFRSGSAAPYNQLNKDYNMNNNASARDDARHYGWVEPDLGRRYHPSPRDWTEHPVYQVIVDRFFDGDPHNNAQHDGFLFDWQTNEGPLSGFDVRDLSTRQGGDWKGLTKKLDYILGMGCRAMWISPVQQNTLNSPMGYLGVDKTLLERRFGNLDDFRELVEEAHKRGMYIVVDIVNNHLAEFLDFETGTGEDKTVKFRMHKGGAASSPQYPDRGAEPKIRPKMKVLKACRKTPGCDPTTYQPYVDFKYDNTWYKDGKYPGITHREAGFVGMPLGVTDQNGTGGYWDCNFHHSGEMPETEEGPWNWPLGKLYGTLDDLRTTDDVVVDKLIAASVAIMVSLDIDGFRLDTPREVAYTLWPRWRAEVDKAAKLLGKQNFGTWGELWSTPERAATYVGRGKDIPMYFQSGDDPSSKFINPEAPIFDGLINYNYFYWIVAVFRAGMVDQSYMAFNILEWETTLGYDIEWPSFPVGRQDKVPRYQMWNFCGSHDQHRLTQFPQGRERLRLCQAWVFTWPGIPVTYQGDEQGLETPGSGLAYWGREFMAHSVAWSSIPTVINQDGEFQNPAENDNFNQAGDYYRFYRRLTNLRDLWWSEAFRCLGNKPNGGGLPKRISCRSADDGRAVIGVMAYRRSCVVGAWGAVVLLNLEGVRRAVRCDFHDAAEPPVVVNPLYQAHGHDSSFEYETILNTSRIILRPYEVKVLVGERRPFALNVDYVSPRHDAALSLDAWAKKRIEVVFTDPVEPASVLVEIDGVPVNASALGSDGAVAEGAGRRLVVEVSTTRVPQEHLTEGVHTIRILSARSADGTKLLLVPHTFRVRVGPLSNPIVAYRSQVDHDIIVIEDNGDAYLEHKAVGAEFFRVQHAGGQKGWDRASAWKPLKGLPSLRTRLLNFEPGVPLVVQYYVDGSAAYLVSACRVSATETCHASYYRKGSGKDIMSFKGDMNQWLEVPQWTFNPPNADTGDHNWTIDLHVSLPDSAYLIDVEGDLGHMVGSGNDVTNPFFFPFENFCWGRLTNKAPYRKPFFDCSKPLKGPLSKLNETLCACDMNPQTLFLYDSGMNHTTKWMVERFPDFWNRYDEQGRKVHHGLTQFVADPSSGLYSLRIPSGVCPLASTCRITYNDLDMTFTVGRSPPGVRGLGEGSLEVAFALCGVWAILPCVAAAWGSVRKKRMSVITVVASEKPSRSNNHLWKSKSKDVSVSMALTKPHQVLVASLEYIIPTEEGVEKAVAGGLGKVAGLLCQYHPGTLISVHACMPNKKYYFACKDEPIHAVVSGRPMTCKVYRYEMEGEMPDDDSESTPRSAAGGILPAPKVVFYMVDHPIFRARTEIYPTPQTSKKTLEFYALWNQAVAKIIDRVRPDIFHCPDFHAAMATMYIERPLPVVLILHNAEYQGAITTQHMGWKEANFFADIFDLPIDRIRREAFEEGKFTMLKPAVDFIRAHQDGYGVCAVSRNYALEAGQKHAVLWGLPEVRGIENCMPESERMAMSCRSEEEFVARRNQAKLFIQKKYDLKEDVNARIFVFVGRWVKQKGVDYIADIAEWMLETYTDAQLLMIGPVGDPYGTYAKGKMEDLRRTGRFEKSLFVHADFLPVPPELKLACDFCLMPSRDEPFGYVDIEFGWYGAIVVGSLRGGLGKLPGFYFQILNSDSAAHMQKHFKKAVAKAMACDRTLLAKMSVIARHSTFPVAEWQQQVALIYDKVMRVFDWEAVGTTPPAHRPALPTIPSGSVMDTISEGRMPVSPGHSDARPTPRLDPATGIPMTPGSQAASTFRSQGPSTYRLPLGTHRSTASSRTAPISILDVETVSEAAGGHLDKAVKTDEFLRQEPSEAQMRVLVEARLKSVQVPGSAAEVLEALEWQMQLDMETSRFAKLLGKRVWHVPLLDYIIALSYLSGPLVAALPISIFSGESSVAFFVIDPLTQAVSLVIWTLLARVTQPNLLMAAANLSRLLLLALAVFPANATFSAIAVGAIVPADYVFIYYCFMGNSVGDIARLAARTGIMMAVREYWEWLFLGFTFNSALQRNVVLGACALFFSILPAIALINAPKLYREFRLPEIHFTWIRKLHFLCLLGLASITQGLSRVSESALLVTRQTSPFQMQDRHAYCLLLGVAGLTPLVVLSLLLWRLPSYSMSIVKGLACFSLPAVVLRCWAQYEINQAVEFTFGLDLVIFASSMLGALAVYAVAVAVLATVGSRWRFVSYTCVIGVLSNLSRMASFIIMQHHTGQADPLKSAYLPQTLAWQLLVVALPPCLVATMLRIGAIFYFDQEATGMLQTKQQRRLVRFTRTSSSYAELNDYTFDEARGDEPVATMQGAHQPASAAPIPAVAAADADPSRVPPARLTKP